MFSHRLPPHFDSNPLSRAIATLRSAGLEFVDMTESNPTRAGFSYPADLLTRLAAEEAYRYQPEPLGLRTTREAVAADYGRRGAEVDPERVVLSVSTSEAYSWLFKLLCDPGEVVLVPQPSYPLVDHLTRLESVRPVPYHLRHHGRWEVDFESLTGAPDETRAVLLVSPNNPTGSYLSRPDADRIASLCRERGWAIVSDEVFADYPLDAANPATEIAMKRDVLSFTLGGASKSLGLPQVKLGWMVVDGPADLCQRALAALEVIADAFLSVSTPVQVAASSLLDRGELIRQQIHGRLSNNLEHARRIGRRYPSCSVLGVEGGWSLVLRVPATSDEDALVLRLLERERILVHPGYFFDFPHEAFVVVSLLLPEAVFADAFERTMQFASLPQ